MSTPFTTQRSRRAGTFIGFWILCVASIVADATVEPEGIGGEAALALGSFYTAAHTALTEFARSATVPPSVPMGLYLVLAAITVLISLYVLERYTYSDRYYHFVERYLGTYYLSAIGTVNLLLITVCTVILVAVGLVYVQLLGASVPLFVPSARLGLILDMSPQALVFATFLLFISLVTSFVP